MVIFPQEQIDGIAELISSKASITFDSPLTITKDSSKIEKSIATILEIENPNQIDLHYLDAILVSTGWNKNDDVFDKYETWKARKTPVDKPFNFMHDGNDIIGHITGSVPISQDTGSIIADDTELDDIPDNFDILVSSVIYKHWPDEDRIEEIQEVINEVNEGKWSVSMECLFPSFDYAIIDTEGNQHIIQRNETTAFLTKYLRAYDGEGVYQNCKIGRLLRNFTFSGKGLVDRPANPRSIIFNDSILFNGSEASVKVFSETEGNITMADEKDTKISDLEKQIASLTTENKSLKAQAEEEAKKGYEDKIAALEAEIASIKTQLSEKEVTVAELQKTQDENSQALASKEAELTQIKAEMVKTARASKLAQAGVEADKVDEVLAKWSAASDEMFDEIVTLYTEAKKNCAKDKEDMKDMEKEDCSKADETPETDQADASTPEEVVVVEEPKDKSLATAGETPEDATVKVQETAKASLMKSVFKTTRTKNK